MTFFFYSLAPLYDGSVTTAKIAANAVTGAKIAMGSDAQGDILYYNGTDYARLGAGTSGHFLKTQGAGANPLWAAVSGGDVLKMFSASGSTTSTSEVELSTNTFAASDFAAADMVYILVKFSSLNNAVGSSMKIRVNDGTNTFTSGDMGTGGLGGEAGVYQHIVAAITQGETAATDLAFANMNFPKTSSNGLASVATMISGWLPAGFTLSIRGNINAPGTMYWKWWVYRVKA